MPIIGATDIVVHLTGLILLTAGIQSDPGAHAIVPRVAYVDPWVVAQPYSTNLNQQFSTDYKIVPAPEPPTPQPPAPKLQELKPQAAPPPIAAPPPHQHAAPATSLATRYSVPRVQRHVEDHVALLLFPNESYVADVNWKPQSDAVNNPGYSFVRLDKERIRFQTDIPNTATSLQNLRLPRMQKDCCKTMNLDKNYLPPYKGAAAVVDIAQGDVNACQVGSIYGRNRLDTEIALKSNNGLLTIAATIGTATKEIRLKPNSSGRIDVIVANVPASYLKNQFDPKPETALDGVPHYHTYYDMGGATTATCNLSLLDWWSIHQNDQPSIQSCSLTKYPKMLGTQSVDNNPTLSAQARGGPPPSPTSFNFECSNTQWP